jgi:hypothetical protein
MYPNVMGFDVTNGTNKEKRPLARGTIKTSNNKNVPSRSAFQRMSLLPAKILAGSCDIFLCNQRPEPLIKNILPATFKIYL